MFPNRFSGFYANILLFSKIMIVFLYRIIEFYTIFRFTEDRLLLFFCSRKSVY